jgi:chromosome segregation ATPase
MSIIKDEISYSIVDYIELLKNEYNNLESSQMPTVGQNLSKNEKLLEQYTEQYNSLSLQIDVFSPGINLDKARLASYQKQLGDISDDLRRNKDIQKLNTLGASDDMPTAKSLCPICKTDIRNLSLLPEEVKETPMQLEENITYLEAQKKMVKVYIEGQKKLIQDKETRLNSMLSHVAELRQLIRNTRKELVTDDRLPSEIEIEKRLNLIHKIEFYTGLIDDFDELRKEILLLSSDWESMKNKEANLPTDFFSLEDKKKLSDLDAKFAHLLNIFGYTSQSGNRIKISMENYLPVVEARINDEKTKQYTC